MTPLRFGDLILPSRWLLSPLAGYTNLPFRLAVRELGGVGLATTDLVNPRALLRRSERTMELIDTCEADRPVAIQLYGNEAEPMCEAARWLEGYGASVVDINMGCPVHKVTRGGGGSAMMCDASGSIDLVERVVKAVNIPVTVKMRLGWDANNLSAPHLSREFEKVGVAAVIIHGRTREQGFGGNVSLDGIRAVVEAVERIPVVGNGDVPLHCRCPAHAPAHRLRGGVDRPWRPAQSLDFHSTLSLGADGRAGRASDLPPASAIHAQALSLAGSATGRTLRLLDISQGGQLVLQGAQARPRGAAETDSH